jgi:hypothetical protein
MPALLTQPDPLAEDPASGKFGKVPRLFTGVIVSFLLYLYFKH